VGVSGYQSINYNSKRESELNAYKVLARRSGVYGLGCAVLALIVGIFFQNFWLASVVAFVIIGILGLLTPWAERYLSLLGIREHISREFAAANNFAYQFRAKPHYSLFPPALDRLGWLPREEQIISGMLDGYSFRTYIHSYHHYYQNILERIYTRVYEVRLPKRFPHIFLATRRASGGKLLTNFKRHFDDDQRLMLEGNFEDMFIAYTHRRTVSDALSFLAPNVMVTLIDSNEVYNIEIIGDKLYLYSETYYPSPQSFHEGFGVLQKVMKHMDHKLKSWRLVLPNDAKYPFLRSRAGYGTIAIGGKYFNSAIFFIVGGALWQGLKMAVRYHDDPELLGAALILITFVTAILLAIVLLLRRKHRSTLHAQ
jgi:hypothetical protein